MTAPICANCGKALRRDAAASRVFGVPYWSGYGSGGRRLPTHDAAATRFCTLRCGAAYGWEEADKRAGGAS